MRVWDADRACRRHSQLLVLGVVLVDLLVLPPVIRIRSRWLFSGSDNCFLVQIVVFSFSLVLVVPTHRQPPTRKPHAPASNRTETTASNRSV
eukprot:3596052-Rhodomonas_salina.3